MVILCRLYRPVDLNLWFWFIFIKEYVTYAAIVSSGYHPECHTPPIEPEVDPSSWICRQCVFAVATKVVLCLNPEVNISKHGQR